MLGHFTGNCHFIGNREATSWEKILGRKLPLHWKQQLKYFTGNCHFIGKIGNYGAPKGHDTLTKLMITFLTLTL